VVGETDRLHRHCRDQWTSHVTILREDQIQDVADDMSWNAYVLMQVVQVEQVDGVTVELLDVVAWHVEVADYNRLAVKQHELVEQVWELINERRWDGSRRSIDADDDHGSRLPIDELHWQRLKLGVVTNVDWRGLDGITVDEHHSSTTISTQAAMTV